MAEFSKFLGESVYRNRKRQKMTQAELAEKAGVTEQTIRKIEHGEGNPQLEVLYALIVALQIEPAEVFYPTLAENDSGRKRLEILLADCNNEQISELLPVIEATLKIIRGHSHPYAK